MADKSSVKPEKWPMELVRGDVWPPLSFIVKDENNVVQVPAKVVMQLKKVKAGIIQPTVLKEISLENNGFTLISNAVTFSTNVDVDVLTLDEVIGGVAIVGDIEVYLTGEDHPHTQFTCPITVLSDVTNIGS